MPPVPSIWGILNVTPDSFSDGGRFETAAAAVEEGRALAAAGADVLDVGGESTRPGAEYVETGEEIRRVVPVLEALSAAGLSVRLSVDTRHTAVARAALAAGAAIVNDVSAASDAGMLEVVAEHGAEIVLMHMRGTPRTMQQAPAYDDVVAEVASYLLDRAAVAQSAGIEKQSVWLDPGIGFGKTLEHNLALLRGLETLVQTGHPVLLGASRKSFLGALTGREVAADRLAGSLACALRAMEAGARGVRVHDVRETRELLDVYRQIR